MAFGDRAAQCLQKLGPRKKAGAFNKNVHQVSLEAGNSPQMVFAHYRQLVSETLATEWFGIVPPKDWKNVLAMPTEPALSQQSEVPGSAAFAPLPNGFLNSKPVA